MRARFININEKFSEDSDAIHDMGIGNAEILDLEKNYKDLQSFINFEVDDLVFEDVVNILDNLKKINFYTVAYYFNRKYNLNIKIEKNITYFHNLFATAPATPELNGYELNFEKSSSGRSITIRFIPSSSRRQLRWDATAGCRSIHRLESSFLKKCKELEIDIKKLKKP